MINLGRTETALLYNKSGGNLAYGAVVVIDTANASSFTTTTVSGFIAGRVGVILDPNGIANNAIGLVAFSGYVPQINLASSAGIGDLLKAHTVAGQATPHAAPAQSGDFGQALATGSTPPAVLFGFGVITAGGAQVYAPSGLTGAVAASRYVGAVASGVPVTGTFAIGDFVVQQNGGIAICTVAGSPGTWVQTGASKVVQVARYSTGAVQTGTTTIPHDDTIPQNTEGTEFMTLAITPGNASNILLIEAVLNIANNQTSNIMNIMALFQDSTANALAVSSINPPGIAGSHCELHISYSMVAGTTSATTFKIRAGGASACTVTINGHAAGREFGGVYLSSMKITEVLP